MAASDGPMDGREKDLLGRLLPDFGLEPGRARELVEAYNGEQEQLHAVQSRELGLSVLRACLVISYCDGSFDNEELPLLMPLVDQFSVSPEELTEAKLQALYYLRLEPHPVEIPRPLVDAQQWNAVEQAAKERYAQMREDFTERTRAELASAGEDTCYLALNVGPPSFDTSSPRARFADANPDHFHLDEEDGLAMLRDAALESLVSRWEGSFRSGCRHCNLEAPGRRRDLCPRCQAEYGTSPDW